MTVNELIKSLEDIRDSGHGDLLVHHGGLVEEITEVDLIISVHPRWPDSVHLS